VLGLLGAGGMGEVYRARDSRLDRLVALKVLPEALADAPSRVRFEREAKAISALSHPHICALHDVGRHDDTEYLVLELLEGETLAARLARGGLPLSQVLRIGGEIAETLAAAHRLNIVHRDLKPGNVMLTPTGVKLLDFGLAKPAPVHMHAVTGVQTGGATAHGTIVGTMQYMAPEQAQGLDADARSDIFAPGAILHEMATGKQAARLADTPWVEDETCVSPDGRWIAFNSDESGRWEVYVASYPGFTSKQQLSPNGGGQPQWRGDGRELFYLALDRSIVSVPVLPGPEFAAGTATPLFQTRADPSPNPAQYGVTRDGACILALERPRDAARRSRSS
jgi:serine/threonine protein kinase